MTDDGFAWLEDDHRELDQEFQALLRDDDDPVVRELCEHLTRHSRAERAALYPALRNAGDGGDDLAERAEQEDSTIGTMVAELYQSTTNERLVDQVTQLRDAMSAHIEFIESEVLPALRSSGVDPATLARDLQQADAAESNG
jgi:hemerythrin superfamily protein